MDRVAVVAKARHADRFVVRGAQPAIAARDEVVRQRGAQALGGRELMPCAVVAHEHAAWRGGDPQLISDHDQRRDPGIRRRARHVDALDRPRDRAAQPVQAVPLSDPEIALGPQREPEDRTRRDIGTSERGDATQVIDIEQIRWLAADEHAALRRQHHAGDVAVLGPRHAAPSPRVRARQAAVGAHHQPILAIVRVGPRGLSRHAARRVVALDDAAPAQLVEPRPAQPQRAFAIDEQRAHATARHADRGVDGVPATVGAIRDPVVGGEQDIAARADRHRGRRAVRLEAPRQALAEVAGAGPAVGQPPQVARGPDPQRARVIAEHALDGFGVEPDIADVVPRAIARGQLDRGAVAGHQPVGVGPQRGDRRRRRAGPTRRGHEVAAGRADVQTAVLGPHPQHARGARHRRHRSLWHAASAGPREPRAVPAHQAAVIASAHRAIRSGPQHRELPRQQAVSPREMRERRPVKPIEAVVGGDP